MTVKFEYLSKHGITETSDFIEIINSNTFKSFKISAKITKLLVLFIQKEIDEKYPNDHINLLEEREFNHAEKTKINVLFNVLSVLHPKDFCDAFLKFFRNYKYNIKIKEYKKFESTLQSLIYKVQNQIVYKNADSCVNSTRNSLNDNTNAKEDSNNNFIEDSENAADVNNFDILEHNSQQINVGFDENDDFHMQNDLNSFIENDDQNEWNEYSQYDEISSLFN